MNGWVCGEGAINWVKAHLPEGTDFNVPFGAALLKDGKVVVGAVYDNYRPDSKNICLSIAVIDKKSGTRANIKKIFDYPFNILGCERVTNMVSSDNKESLDQTARLGYKLEGILRKGAVGGHDLHIFGMLKEECRWIK